MAQTRKPACTTKERRVVAIEWVERQGHCISVQARVEDRNGPRTKLERTLKFSEEEFKSLNGAQAALEAFHRGIKTEDEEDDGCCIFIKWFPTHIGSWLAGFLPKKRSLTFQCAGATPPAPIPLGRTDTETELLVVENNSARNHVHGRPADRTLTQSYTAANLNSPLVCPAPSDNPSQRMLPSGLLEHPKKCGECEITFYHQHSFDFHREWHERQNPMEKTTKDQTSQLSDTISVLSSVSYSSSERTVVQPWDQFPRYADPDVIQQSTKATDTLRLANVRNLIWINRADATTQGVYGRGVLVRTVSDTVQLVPTVSFLTLNGQEGTAKCVRAIMGTHAYDGALHLQKTCRYLPVPLWTNHLQLEHFVPNEADRRLLELGEECPLTCLRTFTSE